MMAKATKLEEYTVLLLCPLEIEQQAACLMLDEVYDDIPERSPGQTVLYILGRISCHNVAIAGYPSGEVGIGVSGSMASEALRDFPNLEVALLVGIAGGIPSPKRDIRLGDVAVAIPNNGNPGVIGYDLISVGDGEIKLKQWQNATDPLLRAAIRRIQVDAVLTRDDFTRHLRVLEKAVMFKRPGPPPASIEYASTNSERNSEDGPHVHYGTILSGNRVIKSKRVRDELRDTYDGIAIEMEAAGLMTRLPVAVIRGISDLADSNKSDEWQPYAAITAAAYAKEMLTKLGPLRKETRPSTVSESVISPNIEAHLRLALPQQYSFVGRESELAELEKWIGLHHQRPLQKSVITLWGLSGVGKSQLVSEFVKKQLDKNPSQDIFWITGDSKEAFEQSVIAALKVTDGPVTTGLEDCQDYRVQRTGLVDSFFTELKGPLRTGWLLVIDGVSGIPHLQQPIRNYVDSLACGSIILTSRSREVAEWYPQRMEVKGLPEADAIKLLQLEIEDQFRGKEEDVLELATTLKGLPLSLKLAASVISNYPQTVTHYTEKWRRRTLNGENLSIDRALLRSFEVSFEELEHIHPQAAKLLILFGFLDHRDMWDGLCENATASEYPEWLRRMADQKLFHEYCIPMRKLSFIEAKVRDGTECIYEIHPAIHEFSRRKVKLKEEEYVKCAVSLVAARVPRSSDKDFLKIAQRLEPHADQCIIHLEQGRGGRGLDLDELEKFGNLFRLVGRHKEASQLYEGILNALRRDRHSPLALELRANVENNLGLVHHAQRKYELALQAFERSHQTMRQLPVQDEDASMSTLYNKGRSLLVLGKVDEAQQSLLLVAHYFSTAIPENNGNYVGDNAERASRIQLYFRILNDLGETHLRNNDVDLAEKIFKQAFAGQKQYLQESHPASFAVRLNIGRVCIKRLQFESARKIFEYIIATYTEWWGRRHSETMRAIDELANSYMHHGRLKRLMGDCGDLELEMAADLVDETLGFYQEMYGTDSDITILTREKLRSLRLSSPVPEDPYKMYYSISP